MRALLAADIPVIPLKGVCLAEAVYGNVALRPMSDIDLLVKPHQLATALVVLQAIEHVAARPFEIETESNFSQHMPQLSKRDGAKLELHWTILSPRHQASFTGDDLDQMWLRAKPGAVSGLPVLMLSPTDLLLHLCLHVSILHRFDTTGLRNYVDMSLVCQRYGDSVDWKEFAARANNWGVANGVRIALQMAKEWSNAEIPDCVSASLDAEQPDASIIDWVRHKTLYGSSPAMQSDLASLEGNQSTAGKLRALGGALFPPRRVMSAKYHTPTTSWHLFGCYLIRFKDLWVHYSHAMWQLLRRDKQLTSAARQEARLREYLGWD